MIRWLPAAGFGVLALAFAVLFVGGGTRLAIGLVLKPMAEGFGWDRGVLGGGVAVFMLTTAVAMVVVGRLADRFSISYVLAGGLLLSAVGIAAMAEATRPWHVLVLYGVVFAAGSGVVSIIPVGVMIVRQFPVRAAAANALAIAGMGLGQLVILSGMTAVLVGAGWQRVFLTLGLLSVVLIPILIWNGRREGRQRSAAPAGNARDFPLAVVLRRREFWLLLAIYALCGMHDFFVSTHIVAFALDQNIGALLAGNLLAAMGLAGLLGVVATGFWCDRSGPFAPLIVTFVIRVMLFGMILITQDPLAIAVFSFLFGVTFWMTATLLVIFVRDCFGTRHLGTLTGLITSLHHVFGGLSAYGGAIAFDRYHSYDRTFLVLGLSAALALAGCIALRQLRAQVAGPEPDL